MPATTPDPPAPRRPRAGGVLRTALAALALTLAAYLGGTLMTVVAPTTAQAAYYEMDVSLSPDPRRAGTIQAGTIVGDVGARFAGVAPGVVVEPRVTREITEVLEGPTIDTTALTPTTAEREAAITDAARGVALRFVAGSLLAVLVLLGAPALWRHGWPRRRSLLAGAVAWVLVAAGTALTVQRTYRPERLVAFESTGLLELAVQNRDLLEGVEARANQATPYLKNLLALSDALAQQYTPTELDDSGELRVLLVSDIHAANQYALMRTVVEEQDIDLVVDSGDLINLGAVEEAGLSRIFRGIESLGVPYVFVRGNHDANDPGPGPLVRRLDELDNVVLLQPDEQSYTELTMGGLRISGFNDPRYYGDDDPDAEQSQRPARERYLASFADREPPDLAVSHQAPALTDVPGRLRIHGHGHVPERDGTRLQVGTFTGGGTLSHFVTGPDAELTGQPSSFDVLTFGSRCQLVSLHRYQYRAVLEGRPSYDSVQLLNGARVAEPPAEGRECTGSGEPVRHRVRAVDPG